MVYIAYWMVLYYKYVMNFEQLDIDIYLYRANN